MNRSFKDNIGARSVAFALAASVLLVAASCKQNPIFSSISNETEKSKALIEGSPSRVVKVGTDLFVANGNLWKRDAAGGTGPWNKIGRPAGSAHKVRELETPDGATLYVLTVEDDDKLNDNKTTTNVWSSADGGANWTVVPPAAAAAGYKADALYAAGGQLFVAAHADDGSKRYDTAYALLWHNGTELVPVLSGLDDGGMFVGAAYDGAAYYFASSEFGIYTTAAPAVAPTLMASTSGYSLKGIAAVGQLAVKSVIAVGGYPDGNETLVKLPGSTSFQVASQDYNFTGAIAPYDENHDGIPDFLLLGIKSSSTYGYREITLSSGELPSAAPGFSKPNAGSTVSDYYQYAGSLGVVPVRRMHQSWEGAKNILYASTDVGGLWASVDKGDWDLVEY